MQYRVSRPEIWYQEVIIDADTIKEALEKVTQGQGQLVDNGQEFSHVLDDVSQWKVEENEPR